MRQSLVVNRFAEYTRGYLPSRCLAQRRNRSSERALKWRSHVNRRIAFALVALVFAGILAVHGAFSQTAPSSTRRAFSLPDDEIKLLLDHVKATLVLAGMSMDDLVYVQIACTDLSLYDKFNAAYRSYFTTKDLPAREFIGASTLLRGGHFELQAIAVRR